MVGKKRTLVAFSLLALSLTQQAQAQETDLGAALQELQSNALQINFSARVLAADEKPVWNVESSKLTIPGRSVKVRLEGDNVRIYLICTPYVQENGDLLLLAQGQIWLSEPPEEKVKYFSPFYSIPVSLGEKILFFPLGVSADAGQKDFFNIEVQVQIVAYKNDAAKEAPAKDDSVKDAPPKDDSAGAPDPKE